MTIQQAIVQLRAVNEPVPTPMRLPTETEISVLETKLGIEFPDDYRQYLLQASDVTYGAYEPAVAVPGYGSLDLALVTAEARELGVPRNWVPFCEDNGNYYCILPDGRVSFWSQDTDSEEAWDNLAHWIEDVWLDIEE